MRSRYCGGIALTTALVVLFGALTETAPTQQTTAQNPPPPVQEPPFPDQRKPRPPAPPPKPGTKPEPREEPTIPGAIRNPLPTFKEKDLEAIGRLTFPVLYEWVTMLPGSAVAPPAYDGDHAYISLRSGQFISVDLTSGLLLWSRDLASTHQSTSGGSLVFLDTAETVYALDMTTGKTIWELPVPGGLSVGPHFDTGWLILATVSGELIGVRANDGQIVWRVALDSPVRVKPAGSGDRLYVCLEDKRVVAIQLSDGAKVWQFVLNDVASGAVADQDYVYVGSRDNFLYWLVATTGRFRARQRTGGDIVGAPIVDRLHVYTNSLDNVLRAFDRKNGALRWKRALPFRPGAPPVQIGDVLLVSGLASEFRAYETGRGQQVGVFRAPDDLGAPLYALESLLPFDSRVIVMLGSGQMMALQQAASPIPTMLATPPGETVPLEPNPALALTGAAGSPIVKPSSER